MQKRQPRLQSLPITLVALDGAIRAFFAGAIAVDAKTRLGKSIKAGRPF
jgi:hypothetical protein